jgi:hypothetical protein
MKKQSLILSSIVLIFFTNTSFSNSFSFNFDFGKMMAVSGKASIIDGDLAVKGKFEKLEEWRKKNK